MTASLCALQREWLAAEMRADIIGRNGPGPKSAAAHNEARVAKARMREAEAKRVDTPAEAKARREFLAWKGEQDREAKKERGRLLYGPARKPSATQTIQAGPAKLCTCQHDMVAHQRGACREFDRRWNNCGCKGWEEEAR